MVLGLLALAAIPTTIGIASGVSAQNHHNSSDTETEHMRKFSLTCYCENRSGKASQVHNGIVVLRNNKLYIAPPTSPSKYHPFEGFYISYPDPDRPQPPPLGLVSTISEEPPMLNWIYVDRHTREVKYGNRTQSRAHVVGDWGWDAGEEGDAGGLTLEGREGAVAVETRQGWEVRWEDEGGEVGERGGTRLMVSLERKFVEVVDGGIEEQNKEEERTDTKITLASSTVSKSKGSNRRSGRMYRKKVNGGKPQGKEQKFDIESTAVKEPV